MITLGLPRPPRKTLELTVNKRAPSVSPVGIAVAAMLVPTAGVRSEITVITTERQCLRNKLDRWAFLLIATLLAGDALASARGLWPVGINLPAGVPVNEDYRTQFAACDTKGSFRGHVDHYTRGCASDPNALTALRKLPGGAIAYTSKLAVDLDGSPFACGPKHGYMDQCPTSLMLPDGRGGEVPVDADAVPYVVVPDAGPSETAGPPDVAGEFMRRTGVGIGDFGVVFYHQHVVPVIVADTGPFAKLGEGSLALHRALGRDQCTRRDARGICTAVVEDMASIGRDVVTLLFPKSARAGLTPATIGPITRQEGARLLSQYRQRFMN